MEEKILVLKEKGNKKVKIQNDGYGLDIYTMQNGFQWTGAPVDKEMLEMMRDAICEYLVKVES